MGVRAKFTNLASLGTGHLGQIVKRLTGTSGAARLIAIIERNHDHNEDRYGDPDAAYDQWRDDEMMCLHEPGYGWDD